MKETIQQKDNRVCAKTAYKLVKRVLALLPPEALQMVTEELIATTASGEVIEDTFTVKDDLKRIASLLNWAND